MVIITDKAIQEIKRISKEQNNENTYLRIRICGGGCSGMTHKLDLVDEYGDKDITEDVEDIKVIMDNRSYLYLEQGVLIDFTDDQFDRRGFLVEVRGSTGRCGCGSSFSM